MAFRWYNRLAPAALALLAVCALVPALPLQAGGSTAAVTLIRLASDGETENQRRVITYQEMESDLEVWGDGETHYYHQGPVFIDDEDPQVQAVLRWNQAEDTNIDKDMGAVKGTSLADLCDLVGGMEDGQEVKVRASDGWSDVLAYQNVYEYSDREGPIVLTWYRDGDYPDSGYTEGMRLVWFADTTGHEEEDLHVFGNWDWHEAADEEYWYYYYGQGDEAYPTTTGLSGQKIEQIIILSDDPPFWDLNADQDCEIGDLDLIGEQWGWSGEPGEIPEDVNRDGQVDILDAAQVGTYWGRSY